VAILNPRPKLPSLYVQCPRDRVHAIYSVGKLVAESVDQLQSLRVVSDDMARGLDNILRKEWEVFGYSELYFRVDSDKRGNDDQGGHQGVTWAHGAARSDAD